MVQSAEMQQSEKLEDESLVPHWLQAFVRICKRTSVSFGEAHKARESTY